MAAVVIRGLGPVKPHVKTAAEEIATRFQIFNIGGFATSGHITNSDHYKGLALDVMTKTKGTMVAEWALANARRLSITYVIWNKRIYDTRSGKGWQPYSGSSPHTDHVHISFSPAAGDGSAPVDSLTGNPLDKLSNNSGCMSLLKEMVGM